jgi:hypothetical protein
MSTCLLSCLIHGMVFASCGASEVDWTFAYCSITLYYRLASVALLELRPLSFNYTDFVRHSKIWCSQGYDFQHQSRLECDTASSGKYLPTFRRNLLPPSAFKMWAKGSTGTLRNICDNYTASYSISHESSGNFFGTEFAVAELYTYIHAYTHTLIYNHIIAMW